MERKIVFRGKNRYRKEWLYGNLVQYKDGSFGIDGVPVETDSVGQFTGLIDKNRKEIYEGDIIEITNPNTKEKYISTVKWNLKGYYAATMGNNGNVILGYIDKSLIRIISNIHDNPELISDKR